ncbi:MAG: signal peptidase I [Actinomycetota bacterium]|nr:signal peptidase I [Actinomycetota bacterium]
MAVRGAGRVVAPASTLPCAAAVLALLALLAARPLGVQALVDRSDSMQPAIAAGDLVLSRLGPPSRVAQGDIVTFTDPEGTGRLITHRVVSRRRGAGGAWAFVTRGDANSGSEHWTVEATGTVGRYVARVPRAGYAVAWASSPLGRALLLGLAGLALGGLVLHRIWAR